MASEYEKLGASASKAGLHGALKSAGVKLSESLFCAVNDDLIGDPGYYSFIHCDGAGTKSIVAYLAYRESGNIEHFAGLSQDALVMNLDDVFCLGLPENLLLGNALARNSRLIPDTVLGTIVGSYQRLVDDLNRTGVPIAFGGGETADTPDVVRTLLVDAVISGRIAKGNLISNDKIIPGDVIIGLSSTGKAAYEPAHNSGISSNGLTLARHALLKKDYMKRFAEVVDPDVNSADCYRGPFALNDQPAGLEMTVGQALLSPTRTYAPLLARIYRDCGADIHGAIHVTGGGLTKILRFGRAGNCYIKDNLFPIPPIFLLIQQYGSVSWSEMYQVFNMGHRFELYVPEGAVSKITKLASAFAIEARVIGRVEINQGNVNERRVVVKASTGTFDYTL